MRTLVNLITLALLTLAGVAGAALDPFLIYESTRRVDDAYWFGAPYRWTDTWQWYYTNTGQGISRWSNSVHDVSTSVSDAKGYTSGGSYHINIGPLWAVQPSASNVVVAVIDTGCSTNAPDMQDLRIIGSRDCWVGTNALVDRDPKGHGTSLASIIAAKENNGVGGRGICPDVKLLIARCYMSADYTVAVDWALTNSTARANIIVIASDIVSEMDNVIRTNKDVLFVCAVPNVRRGGPCTIANDVPKYQNSIAVGSIMPSGLNGCVSSPYAEVYAPGWNVPAPQGYSTNVEFAYHSGASPATPFVAGVAALLWQICPIASVVKQAILDGTTTSSEGLRQLNAYGSYQSMPTCYTLVVTDVVLTNPMPGYPWIIYRDFGSGWEVWPTYSTWLTGTNRTGMFWASK